MGRSLNLVSPWSGAAHRSGCCIAAVRVTNLVRRLDHAPSFVRGPRHQCESSLIGGAWNARLLA